MLIIDNRYYYKNNTFKNKDKFMIIWIITTTKTIIKKIWKNKILKCMN